jgi:5-formyltetrahydrofolate cyclo-ligase
MHQTEDHETKACKKALRRSVRAQIHKLDQSERSAQEASLNERFSSLPGYDRARTVLLYAKAFPEELDTSALIEQSLKACKRVVCPRVDRVLQRLRLYQIRDLALDMEPGTLGIPEPKTDCPEVDPADVDWVLVPGLAFDLRCYRLGRGAGYYDRLLPRLRAGVACWALCYECQIIDTLPIAPHDVPVDGIASSTRMIHRRS